MLNKDKSITQLIDYLDNRFGLGKFIINDFWDNDLCAFGLSDPKKETFVYISTYGKREGKYFISIEGIDHTTTPEDKTEEVGIKELENKIAKHLKIN